MAKEEVPIFVKKIRRECMSIDEAVKIILEENSIAQPPINLIKIAESMGIAVFTVNFVEKNVKGTLGDFNSPMSQFSSKKRIIAVEENISATSKIFTIAHEIGHYIMHCNEDNDFCVKDVFDSPMTQVEKEADTFAAHLLLPTDILRAVVVNSPYYETRDKKNLVQEVCKRFLVAEEIARRRLEEIGAGS